jgi:nucleotide-binding universal stress UspA family protein
MSTGDRKLDEFESMFRSAVKEVFHYDPPELKNILVITDLPRSEADALAEKVHIFLQTIDSGHQLTWSALAREDWAEVEHPIPRLIEIVDQRKPDLIVSYRHLLGRERDLPFTLGSVLDVLTQANPVPVLVLPAPERPDFDELLRGTSRVMVVTDHITGDDRLANWGVHFCNKSGTLFLAHIEDDAVLANYLDTIDKIREIDSDVVRAKLPEKLLSLPREYIESTVAVLRANEIDEEVVPVVRLGHAISDYQALMEEHDIDLLILNTKDAQQDAMRSMAHGLSVQIRHRPLLLL